MLSIANAQEAKLLRKEVLVTPEEASGRLKVVGLTFGNPDGDKSLGVRIDYGDVVKILIPNYKAKSYSMSAERPGEFDITVKVYPQGRCSGYLDQVSIGESIKVFRMGDRKREVPGLVGLVAFGVGITEALPIAIAELSKGDATQVTLLWALRNRDDEFWRERVSTTSAEFGNRFKFVRIFSRDDIPDDDRGTCLKGRVCPDVLRDVFDGSWGTGGGEKNFCMRREVKFLTVGTKAMMKDADAMLSEIGYPMPDHILLPF
jgi:NAD(P)H-flavin reductase